jgi:hypothetical protein
MLNILPGVPIQTYVAVILGLGFKKYFEVQ